MTLSHTLAGIACLTVPAVTLGYAAVCYLHPFKPCPRCHATGTRRATLGRKRLCKRCRTTGHIPRLGVRLHNHLHRLRRDPGNGAR